MGIETKIIGTTKRKNLTRNKDPPRFIYAGVEGKNFYGDILQTGEFRKDTLLTSDLVYALHNARRESKLYGSPLLLIVDTDKLEYELYQGTKRTFKTKAINLGCFLHLKLVDNKKPVDMEEYTAVSRVLGEIKHILSKQDKEENKGWVRSQIPSKYRHLYRNIRVSFS